jgi:uncharacterized membrane protein
MKLSNLQKQHILDSIIQAEKETTGELRIHLSYAKEEGDLLKAAQNHFEKLKMHETHERNGMLLYLNPKLKKLSVFGDVGIHQKVGQDFWDQLIGDVRSAIREKDLTQGIIHAVQRMGHALKEHFPHRDGQTNELPNDVSESD